MARRKTHEEFIDEIFELVKDEYSVLEQYINTDTKITFKHNRCGHEWKIKPSNFLTGSRCPICSMKKAGSKKTKTQEQFIEDLKGVLGDDYELLSEYNGVFKEVDVLHKKCGYTFKTKPNILLQGTGCTKCSGFYRPTAEDFRKEVQELLGDSYEVVTDYKNKRTKIKLYHKACGTEWETYRNTILNGAKCKCERINSGEFLRKTNDEFIKEVEEKRPGQYEILGEYKGSNEKVKVRHIACGRVFDIIACELTRSRGGGTGCIECSRARRRLSQEEAKLRIEQAVGKDYELIGEYINSEMPFLVHHKTCDRTYYVRPSDIFNGIGCAKCSGRLPLTQEAVEEKIYKLHKDEYSLIGDFKKLSTKIRIRHNTCGHEWDALTNNFLYGSRCPKCFGNIKKTTDEYKSEVYEIVQDEYSVLGEYSTCTNNILMKHNECNHTWEITPSSFLYQGTRCPKCSLESKSKGEAKIMNWLIDNDINYIHQDRTQEECRNINVLPFDFGIYENDRTLKCMIEFHGRHHYEVVEAHGGIEAYEYRQRLDAIKESYCNENKIDLLIIPYWEYKNIDSILEKLIYN